MFNRKLPPTKPVEIEMQEFKPQLDLKLTDLNLNLLIPTVTFDVGTKLDISQYLLFDPKELNRVPKKTFTNADEKNETESFISFLPPEMWMRIFSYLDIKTLSFMMLSCKKMTELTNDNEVRERFAKSKESHLFFKMVQPATTSLEALQATHANLLPLHHIPQHLNVTNQAQQIYQEGPLGFVMK